MSDGNFNRNILPYSNYQSGVRAGKAALRHQAKEAFLRFLEKQMPDLTELQRDKLLQCFCEELNQETNNS